MRCFRWIVGAAAPLWALAGCGSHVIEFSSSSPAAGTSALATDTITKPDDVLVLDALVDIINGYGTVDDYFVEHPASYVDAVDTRFVVEPVCGEHAVAEERTRATTRARNGNKLQKLVLAWTSTASAVFVTTHEAYHYDTAGRLRVVIINREEDHSFDTAFMAGIDAHNQEVVAEDKGKPTSTEREKMAVANLEHELRDGQVITQHWLYFDSGSHLIFEVRRDGLESARAIDYPAISQALPTLYGDIHPANVVGRPYLIALIPTPQYAYRPLLETIVNPAASMWSTVVAADPFDGEVSLATKPACR